MNRYRKVVLSLTMLSAIATILIGIDVAVTEPGSVPVAKLVSSINWFDNMAVATGALLLWLFVSYVAEGSPNLSTSAAPPAVVASVPVLTNFRQAIETAVPDESVGIAHAALAGSADFRLHVTKLLPGAKVKAHLHSEGEEVYFIQWGSGHLYSGRSPEAGVDEWFEVLPVQTGDSFVVSPGMLHQLHNTGDTDLVLIFGCPDSHLTSDRVVVADFPLSTSE